MRDFRRCSGSWMMYLSLRGSVDVCNFVRHCFYPLGWQRMGNDDFVVPSVFSEDEMMWRSIIGAL